MNVENGSSVLTVGSLLPRLLYCSDDTLDILWITDKSSEAAVTQSFFQLIYLCSGICFLAVPDSRLCVYVNPTMSKDAKVFYPSLVC